MTCFTAPARKRFTPSTIDVLLIAAFHVICPVAGAQDESPVACEPLIQETAPSRVRYAPNGPAAILSFTPSRDGTLTARDDADGSVLWTFRAGELGASEQRTDLITDLAVLRFDANGDGFIDPNGADRVWLYLGLKRAGPYYYALDVTDRTPRTLWTAGPSSLKGLADAWSTPVIARVRVRDGRQNGEHFVLFVGGGFREDDPSAGNRLFMLDAATGDLLWSAGDPAGASDVDIALDDMTSGIAARVIALDVDGDHFADRLYTADTGGRVWRFDIWHGNPPASLVTGGVLAHLGVSAPSGVSPADARRFFHAPDVALIRPRGGAPWFNLAIGSGDPTPSADTGVQDRFYSIRDRPPFLRRSQAEYDAMRPIVDGDLVDITALPQTASVPDDAPGWKLNLSMGGTGGGEKVLAESLTANGVVLFTTHEPAGQGVEASGCEPPGTSRVYAIRVENGSAALDFDGDLEVTSADRSMVLTQPGIPVAPRIELELDVPPSAGGSAPPAGEGGPDVESRRIRCAVGSETLKECVRFPAVIRTYWKRTFVN